MTENRENYCKLLGLNPYKMDSYTDEEISRCITDAEENWQKEIESPSPSKKQKYRLNQYLKMVPDIRSTMDSSVLKKAEFEAARTILERKTSRLMRDAIILHTGEMVIPTPFVEEFIERLGWKGLDTKTVITASGIKTPQLPKLSASVIGTAFRHINDLGAFTPQEFINSLIDIPELNLQYNKIGEDCEPDNLRMLYDAVSKRLNNLKTGKIPNQDAYIQAVRNIRSTISTDEKYQDLMTYGICMRVLEPAEEQMEEDAGQPFSRAYIDSIISTFINGTDADPETCIHILEEFCIRRLYPANFSLEESGLGTCPHCKAMITLGPKCQFCPSCGLALNRTCPKCGTTQTSANKNCIGCGIELYPAIRSQDEMEANINTQLLSGKFDKVAEDIAAMEVEFPKSEAVGKLRDKLRDNMEKLALISDQVISDFISSKYYGVKTTVDKARISYPSIIERGEIRIRYEDACAKVSEADELCVKAVQAGDEEAKNLYIRAAEICPDHPSATKMLVSYPPESPGEVMFQVNGDTIEMKYEIPEDSTGLTYCIYRGENSYPEVDKSTKPLTETSECGFFDKTAQPGVEYYYKIYTKRWGILSDDCAKFGPALVISEVTNVTFEPADSGLKITYEKPRGADRVRVWRKESGLRAGEGSEDELLHENTGTIVDSGLKGGCEYVYLFVAEYDVNGITNRSVGNHFSAATAALPEPIEDLSVKWDRVRECYTAKWTGPENSVLYYTTTKDAASGAHMSVKEVSTLMIRIEPLDEDDGTFRFRLPVSTALFIYPVIEVGNTAVIGKEYIIANLEPFRNLSKSVTDGNCRLYMEWPDDAEYALVAISANERSEELEISRDQYDENGCIEFDLGGASLTTVDLFAVYMIDGSETRSVGVTTRIYSGETCNVIYNVDTESEKGDRKKTRIKVEFSCPGESILPRCVMVRCKEGIPLRQKDGEIVWESDDPIVLTNGTAEGSFVVNKDSDDIEHMRLFFPDKSNYNKYRFVHPLYNRRK